MGVFTEATNCLSPPAKPALPGVGGRENVPGVQFLPRHAGRAGWGRLTGSTTTGHEMGYPPKTGIVLTTPALSACLRGSRQRLVTRCCFHGWWRETDASLPGGTRKGVLLKDPVLSRGLSPSDRVSPWTSAA